MIDRGELPAITAAAPVAGGIARPADRDSIRPYPLIGQAVDYQVSAGHLIASAMIVGRTPDDIDGPVWTVTLVYVLQQRGPNVVGLADRVAWSPGPE